MFSTYKIPAIVATLAALSLLAVTGACRRNEEKAGAQEEPLPASLQPTRPELPARVRELIVRDLTLPGADGAQLGPKLQALTREAYGDSPDIRLPPVGGDGEGPYTMGVGVSLILLGPSGELGATPVDARTIGVAVRVELGRQVEGRAQEEHVVQLAETQALERDAQGSLPADLAEDLARRALRRSHSAMRGMLALATADDEGVVSLIGHDEPSVRAAAAREAGERGLRNAVDALVKALGDDDRIVRLAVLGALARLGDQRAVRPIAALTEGMDELQVANAVTALAELGGDEALRYLETIAASHPREEIRALARRSLDEQDD